MLIPYNLFTLCEVQFKYICYELQISTARVGQFVPNIGRIEIFMTVWLANFASGLSTDGHMLIILDS